MSMKALFLLLTLSAQIVFGQGRGRMGHLSPLQWQANEVLKKLIRNHPEPGIRNELDQWITNKVVYLSYQSDKMPPEMGAELCLVGDRNVLVLVINPEFLVRPSKPNVIDDLKYKQLVLFHEYTHIANHLSHKAKMETTMFDKKTAPQKALNMWNSEWFATEAEWILAKKLNAKHLVPSIDLEIKKHGEQVGFLEGFYKMISNSATISNGPQYLRPTWQKIYRQRKALMGK